MRVFLVGVVMGSESGGQSGSEGRKEWKGARGSASLACLDGVHHSLALLCFVGVSGAWLLVAVLMLVMLRVRE